MSDPLTTIFTPPIAAPAPAEVEKFEAPRRRTFMHSGMTTRRFYITHAIATVFPLTAGILLYGWRALVTIVLTLACAMGALAIWKRIGLRGRQLRYSHAMWMTLLLALALPPHLVARVAPQAYAPWAVPVAAGMALAMLLWVLGGLGSGRLHPVLIVYLLLVVLFQELLIPHYVLHRAHLGVGDVLDAPPQYVEAKDPWIQAPPTSTDAMFIEPASQRLTTYTSIRAADRTALSIEQLIRDRLPPLEDLIVAGQPGPIGATSAVAVIMGGLFLLYRGLIDYRVPLLICAAAFITLLLVPVPVVIAENIRRWHSLALTRPGVGWATAITFANYEIMAGPLLFTAFFLATAPTIRPLTRRGRTVYAILIGVVAAVMQLYLDVSYGPYVALLMVSILTPTLDRLFGPRPLV